MGFLSKYWQRFFNYKITGQDNVEGKETIVISASPTAFREENYNFGKIWIDKSDFSILRIEWDPKSIKGFEGKISSSAGDLKREISWTVYYGIEKNGVRFPSKQLIEEILITSIGKKHPKYVVSTIYENYKFFTVETEIIYSKE